MKYPFNVVEFKADTLVAIGFYSRLDMPALRLRRKMVSRVGVMLALVFEGEFVIPFFPLDGGKFSILGVTLKIYLTQ